VPKASLPDREKQICRRVRAARDIKKKTQQECAELTGIERSTLANYEAEITPLSYDQAKRICYRLNINQWWLATGESPFVPYFDISPNLEFSIKQNALFSEAFYNVLKIELRRQIDTLIKWIGPKVYFSGNYDESVLDSLHLTGEDPGKAAGFYIQKVISMKFHWMPEQFRPAYAEALIDAEQGFWKKHGSAIEKVIRENQAREIRTLEEKQNETQKQNLTEALTTARIETVKPLWPALKRRLQSATAESGMKSKLAEFLAKATGKSLDLTRVSQWLTDGKSAREPGAEYALLLLHWVEQQECQK